MTRHLTNLDFVKYRRTESTWLQHIFRLCSADKSAYYALSKTFLEKFLASTSIHNEVWMSTLMIMSTRTPDANTILPPLRARSSACQRVAEQPRGSRGSLSVQPKIEEVSIV